MSNADTSYPPSLWGGRGNPADLSIVVPSPTDLVLGVPKTIQTSLINDSDNDWGQITNTAVWTSPDGNLDPGDMKYETKDLGGTDFLVVTGIVSDGNGGLTVTGRYPIPPNLNASSEVRITWNTEGITEVNGVSTIRKNGKILTSTSYVYNIVGADEVVTEPEPDPEPTENPPEEYTAIPVSKTE